MSSSGAPGHSDNPGAPGTPGSSTGTGSHGSTPQSHAQKVTLPKMTMTFKSSVRVIRVSVHTKGGSKVTTSLRMRLRRGHSLIANKAHKVKNHQATFTVKRGSKARSGKYKVTMTIDAGGAVAAQTRSVSIR